MNDPAAVERPSLVARFLMLPIRAWRVLSVRLPSHCRFHPSCSAYALEALAVHGSRRGSRLALSRLVRCHPWHPGGLDPVPAKNTRSIAARPRRLAADTMKAPNV